MLVTSFIMKNIQFNFQLYPNILNHVGKIPKWSKSYLPLCKLSPFEKMQVYLYGQSPHTIILMLKYLTVSALDKKG